MSSTTLSLTNPENMQFNRRRTYTTPRAPRRALFPMIQPGMAYGLESVSCELAFEFYMAFRDKLHHIKNRNQLTKLYITTMNNWCPPYLLSAKRNFNQVLYAMVNILHICDVSVNYISWKTNIVTIPGRPYGFPNQIFLLNNVTMRAHQKHY